VDLDALAELAERAASRLADGDPGDLAAREDAGMLLDLVRRSAVLRRIDAAGQTAHGRRACSR
jgi:hypothetical protein